MIPQSKQIWVGVDWGDSAHAVCGVDDTGAIVYQKKVPHSAEGLRDLVRVDPALGTVAGAAIEEGRGLAAQAMRDAGWKVYVINPLLSYTWRKGSSVSGVKNDARDAIVLARGLRDKHNELHTIQDIDSKLHEMSLICDDEIHLIKERTRLVLRLKSTLKAYFPDALDWFDHWTSPAAWDFIVTFPTPEILAHARPQKLIGFMKTHRVRLTTKLQAKIQNRARTLDWKVVPAVVEAKSRLAVTTAKMLRTLEPHLNEYRRQIETSAAANPKMEILTSLPGAGPKLAPRMFVHILPILDQCADAQPLMLLGGVAPVTFESGKCRVVRMRRACQKSFRATLHLFASQSTIRCGWAGAFYDLARKSGQTHARALRNLAKKWLKIIFRMLKDNAPYDEEKYLEQLRKKNPDLMKYLASQAGNPKRQRKNSKHQPTQKSVDKSVDKTRSKT